MELVLLDPEAEAVTAMAALSVAESVAESVAVSVAARVAESVTGHSSEGSSQQIRTQTIA